MIGESGRPASAGLPRGLARWGVPKTDLRVVCSSQLPQRASRFLETLFFLNMPLQ